MSMTATPTPAVGPSAERAAAFDGDAAILKHRSRACKQAREFRASRKYPLEPSELEAEALLALTEAAREYPTANTILPFGAFSAQRIRWRLEDFIQAWYRLARRDYDAGMDEVRRVICLSMVDGIECKSVGPRVVATTPDLNTGLYIEDCRRLVESALKDSERAVIDMRYNGHMTLKQIAAVLGVTHVRARQIHMEALIALREAMGGCEHADGDSEATGETEEVAEIH